MTTTSPLPQPIPELPDEPLPDEPLPEQIGRYRILGRLGAGGMGTVYRAHDPHLDRVVALKLPRFDGPAAERTRRVQRFQREARTAARIWHPHVCPLYDIGEHDGQPFVVMPCIEGQSLAERLARGRYEDVGAAVAVVRQVLAALDAVHRQGVVHRDLKDGNILLDGGRAVLTDFGLARPDDDAQHLTSDGVVLGTPSFMAPEVAAGRREEVGPWTDLYSLGVVLYRMLTGRLPFEGPPLAVLSRIVHDPAPPSRWRPDLDPALEAVVLRALAREPARRFQTAHQFAETLETWCGMRGSAVAAPSAAAESATAVAWALRLPPPRALRPAPSPRRGRFLRRRLAGAALLVVLLLALVAVVMVLDERSKDRARQAARANAEALLREAEKGHLARVNELIDRGADVNAKDAMGETALMKAAAGGHTEVVKRLLMLGQLEVNEIDNKGETALMKAAEAGWVDVVGALLPRVAINLRDDHGETALTKAKDHAVGRSVVDVLIHAGARE